MEVFITNVTPRASESDVTRAIACVLHDGSYDDLYPPLINFRVYLFASCDGPGHRGQGKLTLPHQDVGTRFLGDFGLIRGYRGRGLAVCGKLVQFEQSRSAPREDVLAEIQRMHYDDPQAAEDQRKLWQRFREQQVDLFAIQFGWCPDEIFSSFSEEYRRECAVYGFMQIDLEVRLLRIKDHYEDSTHVIVVHFSQVKHARVGHVGGQGVIYMSLRRPPTFERETLPWDRDGDIELLRERERAFDEEHAENVAWTSYCLRLIISEDQDLEAFSMLWRDAGLAIVENPPPPPAAPGHLFGIENRNAYAALLEDLDWDVAVQLEALTSLLVAHLQDVVRNLAQPLRAAVARHGSAFVARLLRRVISELQQQAFHGRRETLVQCFERCRRSLRRNPERRTRARRAEDGMFECIHITVTPSRIIPQGPFPEQGNRVVRRYGTEYENCFVRVSFADEDKTTFRFDRSVDGEAFIEKRVGHILRYGLYIGGRCLEFLAYSLSALKTHTAWFIKPFEHPTFGIVDAETIIAGLGTFHNLAFDPQLGFCPARYGARISQSFTATEPSITVRTADVTNVRDIIHPVTQSCFTDGIGTISPMLAEEIRQALYVRRLHRKQPLVPPSAFQIR
jgi:RNA-dependent RNA polymerase